MIWPGCACPDPPIAHLREYRKVWGKYAAIAVSDDGCGAGCFCSNLARRVTCASVRTPPLPYRLLKPAEVHAQPENALFQCCVENFYLFDFCRF
jgi:2-polyprenyl-3-methyl-5-hydroxy-6-metoxy-1,4-benzoquinol methylase